MSEVQRRHAFLGRGLLLGFGGFLIAVALATLAPLASCKRCFGNDPMYRAFSSQPCPDCRGKGRVTLLWRCIRQNPGGN